METRWKRAHTLIIVMLCTLCEFSISAQKITSLPFDYSNWKAKENRLSRPDLLRVLPALSIAPETIRIEPPLYEEGNEHFALAHVSDVSYGKGPELGYLILYEHRSTFIYDYGTPFATFEFDYEVPVSIINAIYHDMKENCINRRTIVSSIGQFVNHRLLMNKYGPGDGYYESPEYTHIVFEDPPLLEEFRHEFPFIIGLSVPEVVNILGEFAKHNGYSMESRKDVKEILITLYQLLSTYGGYLK